MRLWTIAMGFSLLTRFAVAGDARGRWELTVGAAGIANSDISAGAFGVHGGLGCFVVPNIELSLRESAYYSSFPNGTNWFSMTEGAADLELPLGRLCPFIGAQFGYAVGIHNTSSFDYGANGGVKFDLSRDVFLIGMVEYDKFLRHRPFETGIREDAIVIFAGIGFRW